MEMVIYESSAKIFVVWNGSIILRMSVMKLRDKTDSCLKISVLNQLFKEAHHMTWIIYD